MSDKQTTDKFRSGNGQFYTRSLFYEPWAEQAHGVQEINKPLFTLYKDEMTLDGLPLISCRKTFIQVGDPTGYKWSEKYLGGWPHLQKLLEAPWFRVAYNQWRSELEAKLQSEMVEKIKDIAKSGSPASFQAAKYLAAYGYLPATGKRGRPSKQEIDNELRRAVNAQASDEEDYKRASLKLVSC